MVFQQNLFKRAYFIVKMISGHGFDFWKAPLDFSTQILLVQILVCKFAHELVTLNYFSMRSRYAVKVILVSRESSAQG